MEQEKLVSVFAISLLIPKNTKPISKIKNTAGSFFED